MNINDVNDNAPIFDTNTDEIVASVPTTAQYGHHVTKIEVMSFNTLHHLLFQSSMLYFIDNISFTRSLYILTKMSF